MSASTLYGIGMKLIGYVKVLPDGIRAKDEAHPADRSFEIGEIFQSNIGGDQFRGNAPISMPIPSFSDIYSHYAEGAKRIVFEAAKIEMEDYCHDMLKAEQEKIAHVSGQQRSAKLMH